MKFNTFFCQNKGFLLSFNFKIFILIGLRVFIPVFDHLLRPKTPLLTYFWCSFFWLFPILVFFWNFFFDFWNDLKNGHFWKTKFLKIQFPEMGPFNYERCQKNAVGRLAYREGGGNPPSAPSPARHWRRDQKMRPSKQIFFLPKFCDFVQNFVTFCKNIKIDIVPLWFANKYENVCRRTSFTIRDSKGHSWSIYCSFIPIIWVTKKYGYTRDLFFFIRVFWASNFRYRCRLLNIANTEKIKL